MQPNQHIAELGPLLEQMGVRHVVIAPGSRNAPLIQLFTSRQPFRCYSIVDERSAGYVALGIARNLLQPVAIVTTSGTAVLNLAPAVAEAFYQHVPLVLLTADRPAEYIRQFNNQVIDQLAPYYNFTKGFYEMPAEIPDEQELIKVVSNVGKLVRECLASPPGPVHVNVPLLEPLYERLPDPVLSDQIPLLLPEPELPAQAHGSQPVDNALKILLLAGAAAYPGKMTSTLEQLSAIRQCVTVAENISNLRSQSFISNPEIVLAGASENELQELTPDLVIGLGGQVVSKRLKNFLQPTTQIITVEPDINPLDFIEEMFQKSGYPPEEFINGYLQVWQKVASRQMEKAIRATGEFPYCNLTAIGQVLRSTPGGTVVHLGNSSTIRYSQLLPLRNDLTYFSNRGTSGIDGCVSTAVGAALVSESLHLLLVGDLSFVYDSNALWNKRFPENLRIIVLNDGGGTIFRMLDGPDRMDFFEEFSVTHHPVSIELLAQAFGRGFRRVDHMEELIAQLDILMQSGSPISVLEVDTTGRENSLIFKEFLKKIQ